eukprot:TRINITY_DN8279_c0_g1_i1.p2 TRINITY_DN8279_c0_g1~~TRINITY_DN8279_c0_g1_i1.p2  ORF type:complete len:126 (-),score=68.78 TRINITY_DN8279_c0_g1_i1:39-416(-)
MNRQIRLFFFLMIRRPPRSTQSRSSAASDVYKRQEESKMEEEYKSGEQQPKIVSLRVIDQDKEIAEKLKACAKSEFPFKGRQDCSSCGKELNVLESAIEVEGQHYCKTHHPFTCLLYTSPSPRDS